MLGSTIARRRAGERGAAAVEFALVLLPLLLLVFGIVGYGVMLSLRQAISQAAAEGARAAAVTLLPSMKTEKARRAIDDALGSYGIACVGSLLVRGGTDVGSCAISTPQPCSHGPEQCVRVTLSYRYEDHPLTPLLPGLGIVVPETLTYAVESRTT